MKKNEGWAGFIVGTGLAVLVLGVGIWLGTIFEHDAQVVRWVSNTDVKCGELDVSEIMACVNEETEQTIVKFRVDNVGCPSDDSCKADWVADEDGEGGHFEITEVQS